MEEKFKGIVLHLKDYKDADKIASIFTLEQGIITAKFTGVKKEKAKLKAIAQPFVFAEFNCIQKSDFISITNASLMDNFYPILMSYDKTICGYIILDILKSILPYKKAENELFLLTLNTLKNMETNNEFLVCIDFIIKMLSFLGEGLDFPDTIYVNFDREIGNFSELKNQFSSAIDKKIYAILKTVKNQTFSNLLIDGEIPSNSEDKIQISTKQLKQALRLLHNIITIKFGVEINSFSMLSDSY